MAIFFFLTYINIKSQAVSHHEVLLKTKEDSLQSLKRKKKKDFWDETKHDAFVESRNLPCYLEHVKVMALVAVWSELSPRGISQWYCDILPVTITSKLQQISPVICSATRCSERNGSRIIWVLTRILCVSWA